MPAVPIVAAVTGTSAAVGAAAATAIGLGTVGTVAATAIGSGIIAGATTALTGGSASDVLESAVLGGVTSAIGGTVAPAISSAVTDATGSAIIGKVVGSGLTQGVISEATGGDFLQGALVGGIGAGIDQAARQIKSFSAYSPNPDGTQTYTWDDGSTITVDKSANVLGYTPSADVFNAPNPTVNAQQDVSGKLAALGVAKSLTPYAVTALLSKSAYDLATQDDQGNYLYPIVPVPSDWKAPEYDMAFKPSAPIDFGSPDLLAGTQWENQQIAEPATYSLGNLINTLNMQPIQPAQPYDMFNQLQVDVPDILEQFNVAPTFGMTDIVGNLNDQPVSIADIISGIQSGQNYSS